METASAAGQKAVLRKNSIPVTGLTAEAIGANGPETDAAATTAVIFTFCTNRQDAK